MALENLTPCVRVEAILNGDDITPATRLEYFLQKAATSGSGSSPLVIDVPYAGATITDEPDANNTCGISTTVDLSAAMSAEGPVYIRYPEIVYNEDTNFYELSSESTHTALMSFADNDAAVCQSFMYDADGKAVIIVIYFATVQ